MVLIISQKNRILPHIMNSSFVQHFLNIEGFINYLNHTGYEIKYTNHEYWKPLSFFFEILVCLRWGNDTVTIVCRALVIWRARRTMLDVCKIYISNCNSQLMFASSIMFNMMTSSIGNIFRVTGPLCRKFTGHRWNSRTKASDAELWCFLCSVPE